MTTTLTNRVADAGIERLFDELNLQYRNCGNYYVMTCPVHDGDNGTAVNIYVNETEPRIIWRCNTHQCEKTYGKDLLGFVRGVLEQQTGNKYTRNQAMWKIARLYEINLKNLKPLTEKEKEKHDFINIALEKRKKNDIKTYDREYIRKLLKIPAPYFIQRGFSAKILDKYDIGYYHKLDRVTVPIYDQDYQKIVGFTMRSIYDKCNKCGMYHKPTTNICPFDFEPKWRNSRDFSTDSHLFNFWFAKSHIQESKIAILVEGIGDVLKLVENGVNNAVGIFGSELKQGQWILLNSVGVHSLVVLLDNDEAGITGSNNIYEMCKKSFRLYFPKISKKDVGELNSDEITSEIKSVLNTIRI